ncbi:MULTISPECIES: NAD(P)H-binding protein [unclassified Lactococcus]|uniref:NAD(P)H-binding protein n=1 Tax=unclassified Lactococcus TaxID=2643510 RepID=UPI0011C8C3C6|nr:MULTISPECIES: NAD(P)H-binding protein [unclassified Lactococcus]MQW23288.1 NAD(P)H-binding protein [Lactococcus sp. dk101]TXK38046.1 NAD(P)H-binding protein [Lactococcus sp. dk310]TXK49725.1 NAD(P)H-binding protein [Lactococcus sp. dk322]
MKVLIIGAGGQIPEILIPRLKKENIEITLYGRNASQLSYQNVTKIDGNVTNPKEIDQLCKVVEGQDFIYINFDNEEALKNLVKVVSTRQRIIVAAALGVHDEVVGAFGKWNKRMMGAGIDRHKKSFAVLEGSSLNYTYLRLTWLYDGQAVDYVKSPRGEAFTGVQISRRAVVHYICDLIENPKMDNYSSIGLWEPRSEGKAKPDFY